MPDWTETNLSLADYAGEEIYIAFRYQGNTYNWFIDDVRIDRLADYDAGITAVVAPKNGQKLTAAEPVTVSIKNFGSNPVDNLNVSFKIDEQTVVTETLLEPIAALGDTIYTFNQKVDLSQAQTYTIQAYASFEEDENPENDSKNVSVTNYGACKITDFPYTEGFEEDSPYVNCWTSFGYGPLNKPTVVTGDLRSVRSGIQSWRFSSFFGNGDRFPYDQYLISPEIDNSKTKSIEFYYVKGDGYALETFSVGYSTTDTQFSSFIWIRNITTPSSMAWTKYSGVVPAEAKYVAIHYTSNFQYYLYVDDFTIAELPEAVVDAGVTEILVRIMAAKPVRR